MPSRGLDGYELCFPALCMASGQSPDGNCLAPLYYGASSGLSWKPNAAAFRFSARN